MKPKIKGIIIVFIILIAAAAATVFYYQNDIKNENRIEAEYLKKELPSYSSINIVSDFDEKDNNTLSAFKEAVRSGADVVTLDLCFDKSNYPVICSSYDKINDGTLPLEELFEVMKTDEFQNVQLNLHLRQLGSTDTFNQLVAKKEMSGRIILSGIDEARYGIIQGDKIAANVFYDYAPQKDEKKSFEEIQQLISQYQITGVIIDYKNISKELVEALNSAGVPFIVKNVNKKSQMYSAIDMDIGFIQTKNSALLNEIYNKWKDETVKKFDSMS